MSCSASSVVMSCLRNSANKIWTQRLHIPTRTQATAEYAGAIKASGGQRTRSRRRVAA